jgi:hypothetical protein
MIPTLSMTEPPPMPAPFDSLLHHALFACWFLLQSCRVLSVMAQLNSQTLSRGIYQ